MATRFVILSAPRSGSTMLRTMLDAHPDVACHGELLNPGDVYGVSAKRRAEADPAWRASLRRRRDADPVAFLDAFAFEARGCSAVGFKLLEPHAFDPGLAPAVARLTADRALRVIALERRNLLARHVSELLHERGVHLAFCETERPPQHRVRVDPERFLADCRARAAQRDALRERLRGAWMRTSYEDLVGNRRAALARLFAFLGVAPQDVAPATVKVNGTDLAHIVENWDEIEALRDTPPFRELLAAEMPGAAAV